MAALTAAGQVVLLFLPAGLCTAGVLQNRPVFVLLSFPVLLFLLRILPLCRGDEVLWAVLLLVPVSLPVNLPLGREFVQFFWADGPRWLFFLRSALVLHVLFSAEALPFCMLAYLLRAKH